MARQTKFVAAPFRAEPGTGDEEQHRLAAIGGLPQSLFPLLAGLDAALGIEIEKKVVPALGAEPLA